MIGAGLGPILVPVSELTQPAPTPRAHLASVRVAEVARRQWGLITRAQLVRQGVSGTTISRWLAAGRLCRVHPGVYAVGAEPRTPTGALVAALLYAGPGAALSHQTAAWWWDLFSSSPRIVQISGPRRVRSLPSVHIHTPRELDVVRHKRLRVTPVSRTLVDLAGTVSFGDLRRALSEADHRRLLDPAEVGAILGRGHRGAGALREALRRHLPVLARTRSELELRFLELCEVVALPIPEVNVFVEGLMVDALWRNERVVVELDGHAAHDREAAAERDRHRDLILRGAGYRVHRYTWQQVTREPESVIGDLREVLELERRSAVA